MAHSLNPRTLDREILAQRLNACAQARWYVLNCDADCRAHNRAAYRQRIFNARWWRTTCYCVLGGR